MIAAYSISNGLLRKLDCSTDAGGLTDATWIDLIEPTDAQERTVEALLHVNIPTREEVRTIDESSQAYREGDALIMTARVISKSDSSNIKLVSVTFLLTRSTLITLRYGDPMPFRTFVARAEKEPARLASGETIMVGLLETIVDRAAEILQTVGDELETLSTDIFTRDGSVSGSRNRADLRPTLQKIGRNGDLANRVRVSLHSLARIIPYLLTSKSEAQADDISERLKTVTNDIKSLLSHDGCDVQRHILVGCDARTYQHPAERHHQNLLRRGRYIPSSDTHR